MDRITVNNIRAVLELDKAHERQLSRAEKIAVRINEWCGTVWFLIVHFCLFGAWITFNLFSKVDPYPFIFLTMMVSLESIFLSGLLLIAQNRISAQQDKRHQLNLQINMLAEQENTMALRVIDRIAKKLNVDSAELTPFLNDTNPGEVMTALENEKLERK